MIQWSSIKIYQYSRSLEVLKIGSVHFYRGDFISVSK